MSHLPSKNSWDFVGSRLNAHLLRTDEISAKQYCGTIDVSPTTLLNRNRFDIPAKLVYAYFRENKIDSTWGFQVYDSHIRAFNNYSEGDESGKNSIDDFLRAYNAVLDSIGKGGFDLEQSIVPVTDNFTVIDGGHRAAACLCFNQPVSVAKFARSAPIYDYQFFASRGMPLNALDFVALEYCRIHPNSYAALVFPSAPGQDSKIEAILNEHGEIFYHKVIPLTKNGPLNFVRQLYSEEPWVGTWANQFRGAQGKANACFPRPGPMRLYLFTSPSLDEALAAKHEIRALFGIQNHSIHTSDTRHETIQIAQMLLNENSIHFLVESEPIHFPKFSIYFDQYRQWLTENHLDDRCFCVDGSATMAAYGLRDAADFDFIHHGFEGINPDIQGIASHNTEHHHHKVLLDEIIFNPSYHFYYYGVKFISLTALQQMKSNRGESKDRQDVKMINAILAPSLVNRLRRLVGQIVFK